MKFRPSHLAVSLLAGAAGLRSASACLEVSGIVTGGNPANGTLNLEDMGPFLGNDTAYFDTPLGPILANCSFDMETSIMMREILGVASAVFSVTSMFNPITTALDIFGDKETSDARRRCHPEADDEEGQYLHYLHMRTAILYASVYAGSIAMPFCNEESIESMAGRGHPLELLTDITDDNPLLDTPWGLAKAYVDEVFTYLNENDGWNADGSMSRDFNRIPFSDYDITDSYGNSWETYTPKNTPYEYKKEGHWQPLMESNGLGYIHSQEHMVPHIGVAGRFFGFYTEGDEEEFASRESKDPDYSYKQASEVVLEESRLMATDPIKQAAVTFWDFPFTALIPLVTEYFVRGLSDWTMIDFYQISLELQLAAYNAVVLSFKEKMRHDRPRPQTVITDEFEGEMIEAYAGAGVGVQTMLASEWEALIRTRPRSEYPSTTACICEAWADQVALFTGEDENDPPVEFGPFSGENAYASWSEASRVCGNSRVWGGMNFEESVSAGWELCSGGQMAVSVAASVNGLIAGEESAAVFKGDLGEMMLRTESVYRGHDD